MYRYLSLILLASLLMVSCSKNMQHLADAEIEYIEANESIVGSSQTDSGISTIIQPYKDELVDEMSTVLGQLPEDLKKSRPNSNMGNWFCDGLLHMANKYSSNKVDFAIQNYGGLRLPYLNRGPVTVQNIFELMPFDNKLVILAMDETQMQDLLDNIADDGGWPISRGVSFSIEEEKAIDIKINGQPLGNKKTYQVALPDYVANGGGGCHFLKSIPQEDTGYYIRDVFIDYLKDIKEAGKQITVDSSKRIF